MAQLEINLYKNIVSINKVTLESTNKIIYNSNVEETCSLFTVKLNKQSGFKDNLSQLLNCITTLLCMKLERFWMCKAVRTYKRQCLSLQEIFNMQRAKTEPS